MRSDQSSGNLVRQGEEVCWQPMYRNNGGRPPRWVKSFLALLLLCLLALPLHGVGATVTAYYDRSQFGQALGASPSVDNFLAYSLGPVVQGTQEGEFTYYFDPATTQPAIIAGGGTGNLLGGYPYSVLVGGDALRLSLTVTNPANGDRLRAFGGDFYYAPSAFGVQSNSYLLTLGDGLGQGQFAGNLPLTGDMGSFFLGLIAAPGAEFTSVVLNIVQTDTNTIVPACQVSNVVYLKVQANPPLFSRVALSGTTITLQGNGGMPATVYYLRASTNVALPRFQWPRIATNYFDLNGGFTITDIWDTQTPEKFYTLEVP